MTIAVAETRRDNLIYALTRAARPREPLQERERGLDGRARLVALLAREGRHRIARRRVERQDLPRRGARDGAGPGPRGRWQRLARDGTARRRGDEGFDEPYSWWLSTSRLVVARGLAPALFREGSHGSLPAVARVGRACAGRLPRTALWPRLAAWPDTTR